WNLIAQEMCIRRLCHLEADPRFSTRSLTIHHLRPIWNVLADRRHTGDGEVDVIVDRVISAVGNTSIIGFADSQRKWDAEVKWLPSPSAENRVVAFERLSESLLETAPGAEGNDAAALFIAAAAFSVGHGTSHARLLMPYTRAMPSCLVWFGLFAGIGGIKFWD